MPRQLWQFNNKVTVQKATDAAPNADNEVLPQFLTSFNRWAALTPKNGREFVAAMQTVPALNLLLVLQWDSKTSQITPRDRIVMKSRTLNIAAMWNEDEDNHFIVLACVEPVYGSG